MRGNRIVGLAGRLDLALLDVNGHARKARIAAGVVSVKVAVDDDVDVLEAQVHAPEGLLHGRRTRPVTPARHFVDRSESGVEQEKGIGMPDDVAAHRNRLSRIAPVSRRHQEAKVDSLDGRPSGHVNPRSRASFSCVGRRRYPAPGVTVLQGACGGWPGWTLGSSVERSQPPRSAPAA